LPLVSKRNRTRIEGETAREDLVDEEEEERAGIPDPAAISQRIIKQTKMTEDQTIGNESAPNFFRV